MGININSNLSLGSKLPLDSRQVVDTLDDLLALDTNILYNGIQVYVNELDVRYQYHEDYNETSTGNWKLSTGGGGEDAVIPYIGDNGNWYVNENDTGVPATGQDGMSAYEVAVAFNGFVGTEQEWLESLKGTDGIDGYSPTVVENANNTEDNYKLDITTETTSYTTPNLKGKQGVQGEAGKDGEDGTTYTPSIGEVTTVDSTELASATVSVNTETKEAVFNFAIPRGNRGLDGVQISDNETVEDKTWSSQKTSSKIAEKIDKTNILTALDDAATDDQVYSAKLVNDELDKKANNDEVLKKTDIVDNLTSTDTDKPLSANQGKILNDTKLNKTDANKLNCVTIDNVSLKEYILTNFTEIGKTYYLIARTTCTDLPKASNFYITVETPGLYTYKVTAKELNDSNGKYVCTYRTISSSWTAWEKVLITGDITTTISDSSTDTQVPSAKAVFNSITSISAGSIQDNLTSLTATTNLNDFKGSSFMIGRGTGYNNETTNIPNGVNGAFVVEWFPYDNGDRHGVQKITLVQPINNNYYTFERSLSNNVWCNWRRVCTTSVADVDVTTITPVNSAITGTIEYTVKNGICYVSMKDLMSTISSTNLLISTTMPKPSINCTASSVNAGGNIATIYIDKNTTNLRGNFYTKNAKSDCSFSYPVEE